MEHRCDRVSGHNQLEGSHRVDMQVSLSAELWQQLSDPYPDLDPGTDPCHQDTVSKDHRAVAIVDRTAFGACPPLPPSQICQILIQKPRFAG